MEGARAVFHVIPHALVGQLGECPYSPDPEYGHEGIHVHHSSAPSRPTKAALEARVATHWPYRRWCPHGVRGKGKRTARTSGEHRLSIVPVVAMGYIWVTEAD